MLIAVDQYFFLKVKLPDAILALPSVTNSPSGEMLCNIRKE
ncbi:hypothetical protein [Anabaena sp. CCY 0017]